MITFIKEKFWPWGIVIFLVIFMSFFVGFAIWTFSLPINLVETEYYEKGQVYQTQIDIKKRTQTLSQKPQFEYKTNNKQLVVRFPSELAQQFQSGNILFYYSADNRQDVKSSVALTPEGTASFNLSSFSQGPWIAKFRWKMNNNDYYLAYEFQVK